MGCVVIVGARFRTVLTTGRFERIRGDRETRGQEGSLLNSVGEDCDGQLMNHQAPPQQNNPHSGQHSQYCRPVSGLGKSVEITDSTGKPPTPDAVLVHRLFREFVLSPDFPCVLGRSALAQLKYRFALYPDMRDADAIEGLRHDLCRYAQERTQVQAGGFATFVACFEEPIPASESEFEALLWAVLQMLHDGDAAPWDANTVADPESPQFSFSFSGVSFFVVGMHELSSRMSRAFAYPTLVFNLHEQFGQLRQAGKFDRVQKVIRDRDRALQGSINPVLANYGSDSEARQYSGQDVGAGWTCPFRP